MAVKEDGLANLADMGNHLHKLDPGFDPRSFGYIQLSQLIKSFPNIFEIKSKQKAGLTIMYVKLK